MKAAFKIVLLFLFALMFCHIQSQNLNADSLMQLLSNNPKNDTNKVIILNKLAYSLHLSDTDTVKVLAEKALKLSKKLRYKRGEANSLRYIGVYYDMKSNYPMALKYYQEALLLSEEINNKKAISDCLNSMGIIYTDQGDPEQSLKYFQKAVELFIELGDLNKIPDGYNNLGVAYYDLKDLDKSLEYYLKSIEYYKKIDSESGVALVENNIGEIYRDKGEYELALDYFNQSLEISTKINDVYGISYLYMDITSVYILTNEPEKALSFAQKSLQMATESGYVDIQKEVYLQLSTIYNRLGNYEKAYQNHVLHKKLNDSLYNDKDLEKKIGLEYKYKYEKEKQETRILQEEEIKRQKLIRNFLIGGILLLLILIILIVRGWRQKTKTNKLLSIQNEKIEKKRKQVQEQNEEIQQLYEELSAANEVLFAQKEELEKHRNNLESLVKERTIELERAKDKAEESDRLKSAFLTNMSHEIRTPLNAIIGFADLLADPEIDQNTKDELYTHMNHSTETLLKLIDDIFDIAKIESGQLSISKSMISINEVIEKLIPIYKEKRIRLQKEAVQFELEMPDQQIMLETDPLRIQQVLINLIDNAFKFTEKGSVKVGFKEDVTDPNQLIFFVRDSGIGMNQEQINYIFDRFIKVEEDTTKIYRGAGLGLAISKNIVELLGGKLWVESELGEGSVFYFSMPI
jgi:signal transduction histidine kinase/Tfp pilus assembly protein PilF